MNQQLQQNLFDQVTLVKTNEFDGADYQSKRDKARLEGQILRVFDAMQDGKWRSLQEISKLTNDPPTSISAQLRHCRKKKFGGHTVNKKYIDNGLYKYQLIPNGEIDRGNPLPKTNEVKKVVCENCERLKMEIETLKRMLG